MSGLHSEDKFPIAAAVATVVVANVVGYLLQVTIYTTILATPFAIAAFMIVRYALYGSPLPDVLSDGV
ncbi:hypothetical protein [Halobellus ruber]|uniref:Uncharacterized protein n=1 Tax=Halobellus ruber TaxID=2761102 RepID=A0A7J9SGQ6_9EURY|nr:hypothetical protein [Halobellus ruber]MBB6646110.1 hypothetical protein [Halobellus ruber]